MLNDMFVMFYFQASWRNIEYNFGNYFDGSNFIAPLTGIYSFYITSQTHSVSTSGQINLYANDKLVAFSSQPTTNGLKCTIMIHAFKFQY